MIKMMTKTFLIVFIVGYSGAYLLNWNNAFTVNRLQEIAYYDNLSTCTKSIRNSSYGVIAEFMGCSKTSKEKTGFDGVEKNFFLPII